jgi:hypothetical protein
MAVKLLDLAAKLDGAEAGGVIHKLSPSERALLMEALSAIAPLLDHASALDVSPEDMAERRRCAEYFQSAIDLIGASAT